MENVIIKFIPNDDAKERIIHKIQMPSLNEKGFYQQGISFDAFRSGKRSGATKRDKEMHRDSCCWSPDGLYCCTEPEEAVWLVSNSRTVKSFEDRGMDTDNVDETKFKTVCHKDIYAFYDYIGFDRHRRNYKPS